MGHSIEIISFHRDGKVERKRIRTEFKITTFCLLAKSSPGLVVMGDDSCFRGCGFESRRQILGGHFSHLFVVKIVLFVRKDQK